MPTDQSESKESNAADTVVTLDEHPVTSQESAVSSRLPDDAAAPSLVEPIVETPPVTSKETPLKAPPFWRSSPAAWWALLMSCYGTDVLLSDSPLGIGAALGVWLVAMAVLVVRRDLPAAAVAFIAFGSVLNAAALVVQGTWWNAVLGILLLPFVLYLPRWREASAEKPKPSLCWWNYWFQRPEGWYSSKLHWGRVTAWALTLLIGLGVFCVFLNIFAAGNPVVALVRTWLQEVAGTWLGWIRIDASIFSAIAKWWFGFVFFGFLLFPLRRAVAETAAPVPSKPILPALPFVVLLFINVAFLIANGADLAFLWRGVLPEGISQTSYLYKGVDALLWAAVLAAVFLLGAFRNRGSVRASLPGKAAGYALVLQTALLAASVCFRLVRQVEAYGFSPTRVVAALSLSAGFVLLMLLVGYMAGKGYFRRYLTRAAAVAFFALTFAGIRTPTQLSGDLNLALMGDNPRWNFTASDMRVFDVARGENIPFALAVYRECLTERPEEAEAIRSHYLSQGAKFAAIDGREPNSWRNVNLRQAMLRYDAESVRALAPLPEAEQEPSR